MHHKTLSVVIYLTPQVDYSKRQHQSLCGQGLYLGQQNITNMKMHNFKQASDAAGNIT